MSGTTIVWTLCLAISLIGVHKGAVMGGQAAAMGHRTATAIGLGLALMNLALAGWSAYNLAGLR